MVTITDVDSATGSPKVAREMVSTDSFYSDSSPAGDEKQKPFGSTHSIASKFSNLTITKSIKNKIGSNTCDYDVRNHNFELITLTHEKFESKSYKIRIYNNYRWLMLKLI